MSFFPFFRSCFTDWGAYIMNSQGERDPICQGLEMRVMDCLEAYGIDKGRQKCHDLAEDFAECSYKWKQTQRVYAMRMERHKQYLRGDKKEHYAAPPPVDSS